MSFHVGQRVVCIKGAHPRSAGIQLGASVPKKGDIVTVRSVDEFTPGAVRLRFEEHRNDHVDRTGWMDVEPGFHPSHFRPLDERRLDQFRVHLAPTPKTPVDA